MLDIFALWALWPSLNLRTLGRLCQHRLVYKASTFSTVVLLSFFALMYQWGSTTTSTVRYEGNNLLLESKASLRCTPVVPSWNALRIGFSHVFLWSTYTKPWGYQKNDYWASCKTSCTEGIDPTDPPEFATPWTCKAPEMLTCLQSLQSVGLGRDLFEPFLPNFRSLLHWEPGEIPEIAPSLTGAV